MTSTAALVTIHTAKGAVVVPAKGTRFVRTTPDGRLSGVAIAAPKVWHDELGVGVRVRLSDGTETSLGFVAGFQVVEVAA